MTVGAEAIAVEVSPAEERIARRVVELLRETPLTMAPAVAVTSDVLTRTEAMAYVKRRSEGAFCEWCQKWGVKPADRGRYSRSRLDVALAREARKRAF